LGLLLKLTDSFVFSLPHPKAVESGSYFRFRGKGYFEQIMIRLLRGIAHHRRPVTLGNLEWELMQILWSRPESSVRDVVDRLQRPLAYTTVMTTLDRLYKKGLLERRKSQRAFFYSPSLSREEWERQRAGHLIAGFLDGPRPSRELLLSCFLEAVGTHDAALLDELEKKIRLRRRELERKEQS
jgi:predicted transcriptional regulator